MEKITSAQDAIKQVYDAKLYEPQEVALECGNEPDCYDHCLLDSRFWQALGKARGWEKDLPRDIRSDWDGEKVSEWTFEDEVQHRAVEWFRFRLSGGDETKFWQSLP